MESHQLKFSWKIKLSLVLFGLLSGLGIFELASRYLLPKKAGVEFESVEDLRRAMIDPNIITNQQKTDGVNLREIIQPHPDNKIIYELRPNVDAKFKGELVTTNSCGMRNPERSITKAPGVYRIALLGDSFTFGWGVKQNESFGQVLEDTLNKISAGKTKYEVLNFGVPGYSTFQEVYHFLDSGKDFSPDAVLIFFVENDFGMPFFVRNIDNNTGLMSSLSFAKVLQEKLDPRAKEHELELRGLDPSSTIKVLSDYTRSQGIELSLAFNPKKNWKAMMNQIRILRSRPDINIIPLRRDFMRVVEQRKIKEQDLTLTTDPHPSALKHRIMGEILSTWYMGNS